MEIKIIKSKDLKEFECLINEFFFLKEWFNEKPFYFKKEYIKRKHIATFIMEKIDLSAEDLGIRTIIQKERLAEDTELKERLLKALKRFYPNKYMVIK